MSIPNTFIVGAAKSGTTALASLISASKDAYISEIKEPHFHVPSDVKRKIPYAVKTLDEYMSLYEGVNAKVIIDASVLYLPLHKHSIESIRKFHSGDVKVIIILRDPLERAISAYKHSVRFNGNENKSFKDAVIDDKNRRDGNPMLCYQWLSDYKEQVKAFRDSFKNVHIIESAQLKKNRAEVISELESFLGIEIPNIPPATNNEEGFHWRWRFIGRAVNFLFPGRLRWKMKNKMPILYGFFKKKTIEKLGVNKRGVVSVDDELLEIFYDSKVDFENIVKEVKRS